MSAPLYRWPATAKFGRVIPKTKFYEHATISTTVREKFVNEVQRITWAYKLADETIHLRCSSTVPEIQVFTVDAKDDDVSETVLTAIDKAVPFPIIFEIIRGTGNYAQTRMIAAHKQLGSTPPQLSAYFATDWLPADTPRAPLPPAIDLPSLYSGLLTPILPFATRSGEKMSEVIGRMDQARKLEREIAGLERRIRSEPQLNRKVELRRRLRDRTAALAALTDPAARTTEDAPWRS
ncbi:DUF4391 domain-containing protein [Nonomuraea angiospora]|uniref:DUF4391 domain-containing protein n=1 Tax=Nonomuraea angiospora TaxID=46172 RepID=A0ABR9M1K3_9ACTN|nr:DUF4391 domain-containing protein [Nonomuraea angiospora]MBE1586760.1 hypothetical protein [Nonomuraea angiospora]